MPATALSSRGVLGDLEEAFDQYICGWGPVQWRSELSTVSAQPNVKFATVFRALADVEGDSLFMRRKLGRVGILRNTVLDEFTIAWSAEESEHSRALTRVASLYGVDKGIQSHDLLYRDKRSVLGSVASHIARLYPTGMTAAYLALGVAQEYTALTIYNHLAKAVDCKEVSELLRRLSRQEGRHMRFYRVGAEALLGAAPLSQRFVKAALERYWRPVGIDLLGWERWIAAFGPFLAETSFRNEMLELDGIVGNLPGMAGTSLMETFIKRVPT